MKVAIINGNGQYHKMFESRGWQVVNEKPDLVCFTGGEDVSPELYGQEAIPGTYSNKKRDEYETQLFQKYLKAGVPMVGICRGGQFLNVMCGGKLWQDVDGHGVINGHVAFDTETNEEFKVSSTHHQMMRPSDAGEILAVAHESTVYGDEQGYHQLRTSDRDIEVVLYKEQRVLCFQPHPEFNGFPECTEAFFKYLKRIVGA
jgi:gamma-glutamyl-gamma-aminobutyrate hydrolase PuuD